MARKRVVLMVSGSVLGIGLVGLIAGLMMVPLLRPRESTPSLASQEEPGWAPHIRRLDAALAANRIGDAEQAWHAAYVMALRARSWQGLIAVGDASRRIASVTKSTADLARARQHYRSALFLARGAGSLEGVLQVTERFAALGDAEVVAQGLEIARRVAQRTNDADARAHLAAAAAAWEAAGLVRPGALGECPEVATAP